MATTPATTHPPSTRPRSRRTLALGIGLAIATLALLSLSLLTSATPAAGPTPSTTAEEPHTGGSGDPCSQRFERRGGFLEGLGPANRCDGAAGTPRTGGRIE